MTHAPTPEQVQIIQAALTQENVAVEALAGTGKTTTLNGIACAMPQRRGLYVAYNKVTADEARRSFPSNVECRTLHSLAFQGVGRRFAHRLDVRVKPWDAARILGLVHDFNLSKDVRLKPWQVAQLAAGAVRRFCYSADDEPGPQHVATIKGCEGTMPGIREFLAPIARMVWDDLSNPDGKLQFSHDVYLKLWALGKPSLDYDFVMLDEAQDSNDLTLALLEAQDSTQLILVGDTYQNLYSWRGSSNQLLRFDAPHRLAITQSFRFGPAVAEEGQKWLSLLRSPHVLRGFDAVASAVEPCPSPNVVLCRTNAGVIEAALDAQEDGRAVAIVGGTKEIERFASAVQELQDKGQTNHPDLLGFGSWDEVMDYINSPDGADLAVFARLIDKYGPDEVIQIAKGTVPENRAEIVVSTAHKSKGRQWPRVLIGKDFREPDWDAPEGVSFGRPEMMLAYVAVTRAQNVLDRGGLAFIDRLSREMGKRKAVVV